MLAAWLTCAPLLAAPAAPLQDDPPAWLGQDASQWPRLFAEVDIDLTLDDLAVEVARGALVRFGGQVFGLVSTDSLEFSTEQPDAWPDGPWIPLFFQREAWSAMHFRASDPERSDWTGRHRVAVAPFLEGITIDAVGFDPVPAGEPPVPILEGTLERPAAGEPVIVCGPDFLDADTFVVARGKYITQRAPNWYYESFFIELDEPMALDENGWLPLTYGIVLDARGRVIGTLRDTPYDMEDVEDPAMVRWAMGPGRTWSRLAVDGLENWLGRPSDLVPGRSRWIDDSRGAELRTGPDGALFARGERAHAFDAEAWVEVDLPEGQRQEQLIQPLADGEWLSVEREQLRCFRAGGKLRWKLALEEHHAGGFGSVAVSGDRAALIDGAGHLQLVDLEAGAWGARFAETAYGGVAALGDGRFVAGSAAGALQVIEGAAVVAEHALREEPGPLGPVAAANGRAAVGIVGDAAVVLCDAESGKPAGQVPPFGFGSFEPIALALAPDASWLATLGLRTDAESGAVTGAELAVWNVESRPTAMRAQWLQFDGTPVDLAHLGDGRLAVLLESGELREFRVPPALKAD
ncbi:MAG: YncE family protein [Planctomycetota bacterium]|jgi:hypothetical protein